MPSKVKEVYLYHLLASMGAGGVRSAIIFVGTCRGCRLLALLLRELELPCAELHSGARAAAGKGRFERRKSAPRLCTHARCRARRALHAKRPARASKRSTATPPPTPLARRQVAARAPRGAQRVQVRGGAAAARH